MKGVQTKVMNVLPHFKPASRYPSDASRWTVLNHFWP